ncbi:helix-turn-helix domain-containing protein [Nocardia sp. CDC159]|uniref:Helix-turn-helix domain-containing protein n=1 Tax=Nocardia pulmonis TaxID=2951408 RepID=A0A9X2J0E9_9NOCA|nr:MULTISPECIES: helix-turn-helix domain-containing protein [Nocardia]MCM6777744.1 helix-turn-helix domain-containing protein [Nocardia pulmonis]MCM6790629.1 helix-turn-helix domain-containing protein [Nocardia sp. CDC159]
MPDALWDFAAVRPRGVRFAQVPHWLIEAGISGTAMKVWGAIARCMNAKSRQGFPKRKTLAEMIGMSLSAVDRALRELRRLGALVCRPRWRTDGGQSSNDYLLLWQPLADLLNSADAGTPLVTNDEGGSSEMVTGGTGAPAAPPVPATTTASPVTGAKTGSPLVTGDEGGGGLIESYQDPGGTRGPCTSGTQLPDGVGSPLPTTCPAHPLGTPQPCGACRWYRLTAAAREEERAAADAAARQEAVRAQAAQAAAAARQRRLAAAAGCEDCDDEGRRPDGGSCDHRHDAARAAAVAAFRAALAAKPRRFGRARWTRQRPADLPVPNPAPIPGVTT